MTIPLALLAEAILAKRSTMDDRANAFISRSHLTALVVAVLKEGEPPFVRAYGTSDLAGHRPLDTRSIFQIASLSKPFAALAAMRLVENGRLSLNDTLGALMPEVPEAWRGITIAQMVSHTSGVPNQIRATLDKVYGSVRTSSDQVIARLLTLPLEFKPGERCEYSNGNFTLLAKIIERKYGVPYEDCLAAKVFKPLGMTQIHSLHPDDMDRVVEGCADGEAIRPAQRVNLDWYYGCGALGSSIADLARWDRLWYGEPILKDATLALMQEPAHLHDGGSARFGVGWVVAGRRDDRIVTHTGEIPGYHSFYVHFLDRRLSVILLANKGKCDLEGLAKDLVTPAKGSGTP